MIHVEKIYSLTPRSLDIYVNEYIERKTEELHKGRLSIFDVISMSTLTDKDGNAYAYLLVNIK